MKTSILRGVVPAFLIAVVFAVVWGTVVQTQYNLAGLASLGVDVGSVRIQTTLRDIFSGFFPTYGGYIVAPSLLVGFGVAWLVARRVPRARMLLLGVAGGVAIFVGIPLVNKIAPLALLIGASRDWSCTFWMAVGGLLAGLLFAWLTRHHGRDSAPHAAHTASPAIG